MAGERHIQATDELKALITSATYDGELRTLASLFELGAILSHSLYEAVTEDSEPDDWPWRSFVEFVTEAANDGNTATARALWTAGRPRADTAEWRRVTVALLCDLFGDLERAAAWALQYSTDLLALSAQAEARREEMAEHRAGERRAPRP